MEILVTGGAGYIGSHVVHQLINQDYKVIVLDDLSTSTTDFVSKKATFYQGSVSDSQILEKIFTNHKIKIIIHFAAKLIVSESTKVPLEYYESNLGGLINLLKSAVKFNIKKIIFSSTAAVYGESSQIKFFREDSPKEPVNPYGSSKLACEYLLKAAKDAYQIDYVIFRYFNVAGNNGLITSGTKCSLNNATHLIPLVVGYALGFKKELNIYGDKYLTDDGTCVRDYIHVSDLARAHLLGVDYILKGNSNIFNLGSGKGYSVKKVINTASEVLEKELKYQIKPPRQGDPAFLVADVEKAQKILNFKPTFSLKDMIKSEYIWCKQGENNEN